MIVEQEQTAKTKFAKTELKVSKIGPRQAQRFDILVFSVTVTNPSSIDLRRRDRFGPTPARLEPSARRRQGSSLQARPRQAH